MAEEVQSIEAVESDALSALTSIDNESVELCQRSPFQLTSAE